METHTVARIGLSVKCFLLFPDFKCYRQILVKLLSFRFHERLLVVLKVLYV